MSTEVKICGIRTSSALDAAMDAGADYFGLVFFPRSPRNISLEDAARLAERARGRIKSVALVVNAEDAEIKAIAETVAPDMFQLHGQETLERTAAIRELVKRPVIKAVRVATSGDAAHAEAYKDAADLILFDAKPSADDTHALPGGNGLNFDWRLLEGLHNRMRFMLAGGLTPENVAEAIALTGAAIVDVSSGVESAPGEKQIELIRRFIAVARASVPKDL
ncbi:MAG: phosphoribosylanthranilate isomerase [Alphaproteobacteria bacterium]